MGNLCSSDKGKGQKTRRILLRRPNENVNHWLDKWQSSLISYFKRKFEEVSPHGALAHGLDQKGFEKLFPALKLFPKRVRKNAFNFFDMNLSGSIDFREFCSALSICFHATQRELNTLIFMFFDQDEDQLLGQPDLDDFVRYANKYISSLEVSKNEITVNFSVPNLLVKDLPQTEEKEDAAEGARIQQVDKLSLQDQKSSLNEIGLKKVQPATDELKTVKVSAIDKQAPAIVYQYVSALSEDDFNKWATYNFRTQEFFAMFELVPDPLKEREIIRELLKLPKQDILLKSQIRESVGPAKNAGAQEERGQGGQARRLSASGKKTKAAEKSNSHKLKQSQQLVDESEEDDNTVQKQAIEEHEEKNEYYVVSWKWWWLWKYYINRAYKLKCEGDEQQRVKKISSSGIPLKQSSVQQTPALQQLAQQQKPSPKGLDGTDQQNGPKMLVINENSEGQQMIIADGPATGLVINQNLLVPFSTQRKPSNVSLVDMDINSIPSERNDENPNANVVETVFRQHDRPLGFVTPPGELIRKTEPVFFGTNSYLQNHQQQSSLAHKGDLFDEFDITIAVDGVEQAPQVPKQGSMLRPAKEYQLDNNIQQRDNSLLPMNPMQNNAAAEAPFYATQLYNSSLQKTIHLQTLVKGNTNGTEIAANVPNFQTGGNPLKISHIDMDAMHSQKSQDEIINFDSQISDLPKSQYFGNSRSGHIYSQHQDDRGRQSQLRQILEQDIKQEDLLGLQQSQHHPAVTQNEVLPNRPSDIDLPNFKAASASKRQQHEQPLNQNDQPSNKVPGRAQIYQIKNDQATTNDNYQQQQNTGLLQQQSRRRSSNGANLLFGDEGREAVSEIVLDDDYVENSKVHTVAPAAALEHTQAQGDEPPQGVRGAQDRDDPISASFINGRTMQLDRNVVRRGIMDTESESPHASGGENGFKNKNQLQQGQLPRTGDNGSNGAVELQGQQYLVVGERPPQIDNKDIEGEFCGELRVNIQLNHDYVLIPSSAWRNLHAWYGGGPVFRRKTFRHPERDTEIIELYPPFVVAFELLRTGSGEIDYRSRKELFVRSRKTFEAMQSKFARLIPLERSEGYFTYFRNLGQPWQKVEDASARLLDVGVESGAFVVYVKKAMEDSFLKHLHAKLIQLTVTHRTTTSSYQRAGVQQNQNIINAKALEVGDAVDIQHASTGFRWTLAYVTDIMHEELKVHLKKQSYKHDIIFKLRDCEDFITLPNSLSSSQRPQPSGDAEDDGNNENKNSRQQINAATAVPRLIGLANIGNTCFINTVMQCLINTPFFHEYLVSLAQEHTAAEHAASRGANFPEQYNGDKNTNQYTQNGTNTQNGSYFPIGSYAQQGNPGAAAQGKKKNDLQQVLLEEFSKLSRTIALRKQNDPLNPVHPYTMKKTIDLLMPQFQGHEQHDAQEFLNFFLDQLYEEQKKSLKARRDLHQQSSSGQQLKQGAPTEGASTPQTGQSSNSTGAANALPAAANNAAPSNKNNNNNNNNSEEYQGVIKDVFMGQTSRKTTCTVCGNVNQKLEDFFTLSLPLPVVNEVYYEVIYVPRCTRSEVPPLRKYGVKVHKNATVQDFKIEFAKVANLQQANDYHFVEVYQHSVRYSSHDSHLNALLVNLGIRPTDLIVFFHIYRTSKELKQEQDLIQQLDRKRAEAVALTSSTSKTILPEIGQFVDICERGQWRHAQILDVQKNAEKEILVKASTKGNMYAQSNQSIDQNNGAQMYASSSNDAHSQAFNWYLYRDVEKIAPFRTHTNGVEKETAFLLSINSRRYNASTREFEKIGLPLQLSTPNWLTWREFHCQVYLQARRYIDFLYLAKKLRNMRKRTSGAVPVNDNNVVRSNLEQNLQKGQKHANNNGLPSYPSPMKKKFSMNLKELNSGDRNIASQNDHPAEYGTLQHEDHQTGQNFYKSNYFEDQDNENDNEANNFEQDGEQDDEYRDNKNHSKRDQQNKQKQGHDADHSFSSQQRKKQNIKGSKKEKNGVSQIISQQQMYGTQNFRSQRSTVQPGTINHQQSTDQVLKSEVIRSLEFQHIPGSKKSSATKNPLKLSATMEKEQAAQIAGNEQRHVRQGSTSNNNQNSNINNNSQNNNNNNVIITKNQEKREKEDDETLMRKDCHEIIASWQNDPYSFLASNVFPYRLRLIDPITERCALCDKPITYNANSPGELYCNGCEPGLKNAPFLWNVNISKTFGVAIDWTDSLAFDPVAIVPQFDKSYQECKRERNNMLQQISIDECLNIFSKEEQIDLECEHCKKFQKQKTKMTLKKLPNILIIHLMRFYFHNGYLEKINNLIDFPLRNLKLTPWIEAKNVNLLDEPRQDNTILTSPTTQHNYNFNSANNLQQDETSTRKDSAIYDLYGVANHIGNGQGGHYTAYVQVTQEDNSQRWIQFDDESVSFAAEDKIVSTRSYLLFYKRREFSSSALINLTYQAHDRSSN